MLVTISTMVYTAAMATTKKKTTQVTKKTSAKAPAKKVSAANKPAKSTKVDYYPNRVPFYVAVFAVVILFLLAVITAL